MEEGRRQAGRGGRERGRLFNKVALNPPLGHYKLDNSFPSTARMPLTNPPIFLIIVVIFYYNKL